MNRNVFKLSAFDAEALKECPTLQSGASFIRYIAWFPVLLSFCSGYVALSLVNWSHWWSDLALACLLAFLQAQLIRKSDAWLHRKRSWKALLAISSCLILIAFLQTMIISNYLFRTEMQIDAILRPLHSKSLWPKKDLLYVLSFRDHTVSVITIAMAIVSSFIGILPFGLTFFYRKSKYYPVFQIIENFKMSYD
ncbi:hypothetical protein [Taibaiella chishuiensis]|uniref:Uncharacterized protein n=1 Tax=Taibaiella chishuiensis TaxID=1434707 RepID=A0A2P8DDE4_9BACT|nr:hypothetical protein [Taibaiella chishuiensis]PSK95232.1 hypothetical protein B0I18_1011398 [Taibaiella chishuiensis]